MANPDIELIDRMRAGELSLPAAFDSSPIARALGMEVVSLGLEDGVAVTRFDPDEVFLQGAGVIQGGAVAAMLDFATILPVMLAAPDHLPATTNLDTVYYRPTPAGRYEARSAIKRRTRSAIFVAASLYSADGAEVASATSTVFIKPAAPKAGRQS